MVIQRGGPPGYSRDSFESVASVLTEEIAGAHDTIRALVHEISQHLGAGEGAYAWGYHARYLEERISAISIIVGRLLRVRNEEAQLAEHERAQLVAQGLSGQDASPDAQLVRLMRVQSVLAQMALDFESLLVFGNLALDQWAMMLGYLTGQSSPHKMTFHLLMKALQAQDPGEALRPLWDRHRGEMIWLNYHVRLVRNRFVEHVDRAWLNGRSAAIFGIDFHLTMHPPDERINLGAVEQRDGKFLRALGRRYWPKLQEVEWTVSLRDTLRYIFLGIDAIEEERDRERVWNLWQETGGDGPSFHVVATRLLTFLRRSTATLLEIVRTHPDRINDKRTDAVVKKGGDDQA